MSASTKIHFTFGVQR